MAIQAMPDQTSLKKVDNDQDLEHLMVAMQNLHRPIDLVEIKVPALLQLQGKGHQIATFLQILVHHRGTDHGHTAAVHLAIT